MQKIKTFFAVLLCGAVLTSCTGKDKSSSSSEPVSSASSVSETTEAAEPVEIPDIDEIPEGAAYKETQYLDGELYAVNYYNEHDDAICMFSLSLGEISSYTENEPAYDKNGRLISSKDRSILLWSDTPETIEGATEYEYDDHGYATRVKTLIDGEVMVDISSEFEYDENGLPVREKTFSNGIQISEAVNTFDADGNKISTESEMKNGYKIRSEFEYDEENRLILTRTILKNSKTEIRSEYEDYT